MQNSHSDVQQSSYRCINHGTHVTGQSSKRFMGAASELGHSGAQQPLGHVLFASRLLPARTNPEMERVPREGLQGTGACAGLTLPGQLGTGLEATGSTQGQLALLHRPSHPSTTASRDFLNCKKKKKSKSPSKNVINIRA